MARKIEADGETWDVRLSSEAAHEGVRSVVFHCSSNTSWGWRVAELPEPEVVRLEEDGGVDGMGESELRRLFDRSQPFDYAHDPKARGETGGPHD